MYSRHLRNLQTALPASAHIHPSVAPQTLSNWLLMQIRHIIEADKLCDSVGALAGAGLFDCNCQADQCQHNSLSAVHLSRSNCGATRVRLAVCRQYPQAVRMYITT
jgi:hypothetical protein